MDASSASHHPIREQRSAAEDKQRYLQRSEALIGSVQLRCGAPTRVQYRAVAVFPDERDAELRKTATHVDPAHQLPNLRRVAAAP